MTTTSPQTEHSFGCSHCATYNCFNGVGRYPSDCLTQSLTAEEIDSTLKIYQGKNLDARLARAAAEVEGQYYGRLTRVEETIAFARKIKAQHIGIANCVGLLNEARLFAKILQINGFQVSMASCKVGAQDKTTIGISDDMKVNKGCAENLCNPILQARLLNKAKTQLNVVIGLCVGHDALFYRHAKAPATTLIVKDRVLGHNPVAALYTSAFYYKRLLKELPHA